MLKAFKICVSLLVFLNVIIIAIVMFLALMATVEVDIGAVFFIWLICLLLAAADLFCLKKMWSDPSRKMLPFLLVPANVLPIIVTLSFFIE